MTPALMHRARRPHPRTRGQAMVEMALVAPILVVLLLGASQVGQIAYSMVSIDTSAREGARAGTAAPNSALKWDTTGTVPASHACSASDFVQGGSGNPVCIAVVNADGFLTKSLFTSNPCAVGQACVTIRVSGSADLSVLRARANVRLAAAHPGPPLTSNCNNGNQATINGTVFGIPSGNSATVTDTSGDSQSNVTSTFTICVAADSNATSQTLTASVGPVGCGGYSGSKGPFAVTHGDNLTEDITVTAHACPTPPPTASPTDAPTETPFPTQSPSAGAAGACQASPDYETDYLSVTVSYPVPIFVPFVGALFQTSAGIRQISTTVTYAIEPCTLTQGA